MGMFDVVVFEMESPDCPVKGRRFQTKSLDPCMDIYTVNREGRLCLTGSELCGTEAIAGEVGDIDFHGDMRLLAEDGGTEAGNTSPASRTGRSNGSGQRPICHPIDYCVSAL